MYAESPWVETPISRWFKSHLRLQEQGLIAQLQTSANSQRPFGHPSQNSTPQGSADDACHSTQQVEDAMMSVDSADQHRQDLNVRLSCSGLIDSQHGRRLGEQACQLRFERELDDDGSNSDAVPHNSPSASGCDPMRDTNPVAGKPCDSQAWSQCSPSNASGSDEHSLFKTTNYMQLPSTASLSDYSCEAFQNCR
jgi:hypothetical protein